MSLKRHAVMTAHPLEKYSSLHELSLTSWLGWTNERLKIPISIQFDFNLNTPLKINSLAYLVFKTRDSNQPIDPNSCFIINQLTRWRIKTQYSSFDEFFQSLTRWHRCNYFKSQKIFRDYGSLVIFINDDWTEHVAAIYRLYLNVVHHHEDNQLYDLSFFHEIAKRSDYKLICTLFEGEIIAMFVLQEESSTLHSICCGMDYEHSSKCYAYSWMHHELIRMAIEAEKYQCVDVGLTADQSKKEIGFTSIPSRMDIYAKGWIIRNFLKLASTFVTATITSDGKLKIKLF